MSSSSVPVYGRYAAAASQSQGMFLCSSYGLHTVFLLHSQEPPLGSSSIHVPGRLCLGSARQVPGRLLLTRGVAGAGLTT